jgi:hypothetical protein
VLLSMPLRPAVSVVQGSQASKCNACGTREVCGTHHPTTLWFRVRRHQRAMPAAPDVDGSSRGHVFDMRGDIPLVAERVFHSAGAIAIGLVRGLGYRNGAGRECVAVCRIDIRNV